jgi:glyoxylase-like metal-dependent hydrolase (beta-lactamase superfamily II)
VPDFPAVQVPGVYRRRIGDIIVTAVSDGYLIMDREMTRNLPRHELMQALSAAFREELVFSVNTFLVQSAGRTVLIDTGSGDYLGPTTGHLRANLAAAGLSPEDVDAVLLTHMHPDHSAGLSDPKSGTVLFPNAELVVHENEPRHWFDDAQLARAPELYQHLHFQITREQVSPYLDRMRTFRTGEIMPGITAFPLAGHTPGHTGYLIESRGEALLIWGDIIHIPEIQFSRPEITVTPDLEPDRAEESRRRILDIAAQEGFLVTGMHLHYPGFGHVSRESGLFRFHPEAWRQKW